MNSRKTHIGHYATEALFIALLTIPILSGCSKGPMAKAKLDAEVKRLCAIDGGGKVYEVVRLPADKFDKYGGLRIPFKQDRKPTDKYYVEWDVQHLLNGNPSMRRDHFLVYRTSDGKLMGEAISYGRKGGDMPGPWHDSSFRCPQNSGDQDLVRRVFIKLN